jgi:murein L,D-transpeptidase YcbB/YkuD
MTTRAFLLGAALLALAGQAVAAQPEPLAPPRVAPPAPQPPAQLSHPVDAALKAALEGVDPADPVLRFYQARNYRPAWSKTDQAALIAALKAANHEALNPDDFLPKLDKIRDNEHRDIALSRAALAYAHALAMGKVNPETVEDVFTLHRNVVDGVVGLEAALNGKTLSEWLASLPPQDRGYQGLSAAYLRYRDIAIRGGWPAFKPGEKISPGDKDARVPALAARLLAEGDLEAPIQGDVYTPEMVAAVRIFQQRHGLPDDGTVGADTQDELQATAQDRARQIATNMERRRWLTRTVASERIDVNTAASLLVYWVDDRPVHGALVINGKANRPTPSIEASFSSVLANPPWNVPGDIAAREIFPKGPGYLASEDMYIAADGHVVQRAGPKSALGLVKFEVIDPFAIYLHDTPSRKLFAHYQRHLSHGCVRVENAVEFARLLLTDHPEALAEFDAAEQAGETHRVSLGRDIPVRMLYWTAFMTGKDRVAFRKDVYGWDSKLGEALGVGALSFQAAERSKTEDVGP